MSLPTKPREFFLTGVTGFLGKVVLAELLRRRDELSIETVHVLIRPKQGDSPETRFRRTVLASDCFSELPAGWHERVRLIPGDLDDEGFGIDPATRADLDRRVTHIVNCAASIRFDLSLAEAGQANVASSLNVLEFARSCTSLESLVAVSTAYVTPMTGDGVEIHERLAPLPRSAEAIYHDILDEKVEQLDLLQETNQPNTYTLTKCLAEHLLWERRGDVPLTLVRPSIISACWRHPFPGWIDSHAAFAGFVALVGAGQLRAVVAQPSARPDIVPCDEVATRIIDSSLSQRTGPDSATIIHATAGLSNSARIETIREVITNFFARHWVARRPKVTYLGPRGLRFRLRDWFHHRLRASFARLWYGITGQLQLRRRVRSLMERLDYLNQAFPYFTQRTFDFRSSAPLDHASFDATDYLMTVCRGINRHLMRRDEREASFAGRLHLGVRSDLRWVLEQPSGNWAVRAAAYVVVKALRRCSDRFTLDVPSFEAARASVGTDRRLVIIPSHRSYMDFVLCSYLFFARPDLGIPIPRIAATDDFARIPILGRFFTLLGAFYLTRGLGEEDKELTRRVHALTKRGETLQFFIEGSRSRARQFLPPRRGLLRCLQATGDSYAILPVAFTYDRVPEENAFVEELQGAPKPKMRLLPLLGWTLRLLRGAVDVGRVHLTCGDPLFLDPSTDVHALSRQVIARLRQETAATTQHLRAFLEQNPIDGVDVRWLRDAILRRGGRVLDSDLGLRAGAESPSALVERCLRYDWMHVFYPDLRAALPDHPALEHHVRRNGNVRPGALQISSELADPRLKELLRALFEPVCREYVTAAESLGSPGGAQAIPSAREIVQRVPEAHLPTLEEAFGDLAERQILVSDPGSERFAWGPRAHHLTDYKKACAWPGLPGDGPSETAAELG
ncbi:MAG: SDR family oxidoreductase [Myxococcota bacterium]